MNAPAKGSLHILKILWGANFAGPLVYVAVALAFGMKDQRFAQDFPFLPYAFGVVAATAGIVSHFMWLRVAGVDNQVHRSHNGLEEGRSLQARLMQVWALSSVPGLLGFVLAFLGYAGNIWSWFMIGAAMLMLLHRPQDLPGHAR